MRKISSVLGVMALAGVVFAAPSLSGAQTYPDRPIRVIVPFPAGGVLDSVTRSVGEQARTVLGQPWVIENKAGAGGAIGLQACATSAPDGYTLCAVTAEAMSVTPHFDPKMYERYKTLVPVTQFVTAPGVVYASPSVAPNNLRELVQMAKASPTVLNYSSWGAGTSPHLFFEWLKKKNNVDILHVPYKGSNDALNEVLAGRIQVSYVALGLALQHIEAGKLKPLAVIGDERSKLLPNTPSLGELGFDFPYKGAWFGLMAPEGTPPAILEKVAAAVRAALANPDLRAKVLDPQGYRPAGSTPQDFARMIQAEYAHGAEIMRLTGIKAE